MHSCHPQNPCSDVNKKSSDEQALIRGRIYRGTTSVYRAFNICPASCVITTAAVLPLPNAFSAACSKMYSESARILPFTSRELS